jgi:hypothetical protein
MSSKFWSGCCIFSRRKPYRTRISAIYRTVLRPVRPYLGIRIQPRTRGFDPGTRGIVHTDHHVPAGRVDERPERGQPPCDGSVFTARVLPENTITNKRPPGLERKNITHHL